MDASSTAGSARRDESDEWLGVIPAVSAHHLLKNQVRYGWDPVREDHFITSVDYSAWHVHEALPGGRVTAIRNVGNGEVRRVAPPGFAHATVSRRQAERALAGAYPRFHVHRTRDGDVFPIRHREFGYILRVAREGEAPTIPERSSALPGDLSSKDEPKASIRPIGGKPIRAG